MSKSKENNSQTISPGISLSEYGAKRLPVKWSDTLPDEIKEQIASSGYGRRIVKEWLIELGYDATDYKVETLLAEIKFNG